MIYTQIAFDGEDLVTQGWWPVLEADDAIERAIETPRLLTSDGAFPVEGMISPRTFDIPMIITDKHPTSGASGGAMQALANARTVQGIVLRPGLRTLSVQDNTGGNWSALAQGAGLHLHRVTPTLYRAVASFSIPSVFFESDTETVLTGTLSALPTQIALTNNGAYFSLPVVRITGAIVDPVIRIDNANGEIYELSWSGNVGDGTLFEVDSKAFRVEVGGIAVLDEALWTGSPHLLRVPVGVSTLTIDGAAGSLSVSSAYEIRFKERVF